MCASLVSDTDLQALNNEYHNKPASLAEPLEEYQNSEAGEPIRTDEAKIMTHPIFTNKEDEGVDGGVTHSKKFLADKNEHFSVEDICLKSKDKYARQESVLVETRLNELIKDLPKKETANSEQRKEQAKCSDFNATNVATSLDKYLYRLKQFRNETSPERSNIRPTSVDTRQCNYDGFRKQAQKVKSDGSSIKGMEPAHDTSKPNNEEAKSTFQRIVEESGVHPVTPENNLQKSPDKLHSTTKDLKSKTEIPRQVSEVEKTHQFITKSNSENLSRYHQSKESDSEYLLENYTKNTVAKKEPVMQKILEQYKHKQDVQNDHILDSEKIGNPIRYGKIKLKKYKNLLTKQPNSDKSKLPKLKKFKMFDADKKNTHQENIITTEAVETENSKVNLDIKLLPKVMYFKEAPVKLEVPKQDANTLQRNEELVGKSEKKYQNLLEDSSNSCISKCTLTDNNENKPKNTKAIEHNVRDKESKYLLKETDDKLKILSNHEKPKVHFSKKKIFSTKVDQEQKEQDITKEKRISEITTIENPNLNKNNKSPEIIEQLFQKKVSEKFKPKIRVKPVGSNISIREKNVRTINFISKYLEPPERPRADKVDENSANIRSMSFRNKGISNLAERKKAINDIGCGMLRLATVPFKEKSREELQNDLEKFVIRPRTEPKNLKTGKLFFEPHCEKSRAMTSEFDRRESDLQVSIVGKKEMEIKEIILKTTIKSDQPQEVETVANADTEKHAVNVNIFISENGSNKVNSSTPSIRKELPKPLAPSNNKSKKETPKTKKDVTFPPPKSQDGVKITKVALARPKTTSYIDNMKKSCESQISKYKAAVNEMLKSERLRKDEKDSVNISDIQKSPAHFEVTNVKKPVTRKGIKLFSRNTEVNTLSGRKPNLYQHENSKISNPRLKQELEEFNQKQKKSPAQVIRKILTKSRISPEYPKLSHHRLKEEMKMEQEKFKKQIKQNAEKKIIQSSTPNIQLQNNGRPDNSRELKMFDNNMNIDYVRKCQSIRLQNLKEEIELRNKSVDTVRKEQSERLRQLQEDKSRFKSYPNTMSIEDIRISQSMCLKKLKREIENRNPKIQLQPTNIEIGRYSQSMQKKNEEVKSEQSEDLRKSKRSSKEMPLLKNKKNATLRRSDLEKEIQLKSVSPERNEQKDKTSDNNFKMKKFERKKYIHKQPRKVYSIDDETKNNFRLHLSEEKCVCSENNLLERPSELSDQNNKYENQNIERETPKATRHSRTAIDNTEKSCSKLTSSSPAVKSPTTSENLLTNVEIMKSFSKTEFPVPTMTKISDEDIRNQVLKLINENLLGLGIMSNSEKLKNLFGSGPDGVSVSNRQSGYLLEPSENSAIPFEFVSNKESGSIATTKQTLDQASPVKEGDAERMNWSIHQSEINSSSQFGSDRDKDITALTKMSNVESKEITSHFEKDSSIEKATNFETEGRPVKADCRNQDKLEEKHIQHKDSGENIETVRKDGGADFNETTKSAFATEESPSLKSAGIKERRSETQYPSVVTKAMMKSWKKKADSDLPNSDQTVNRPDLQDHHSPDSGKKKIVINLDRKSNLEDRNKQGKGCGTSSQKNKDEVSLELEQRNDSVMSIKNRYETRLRKPSNLYKQDPINAQISREILPNVSSMGNKNDIQTTFRKNKSKPQSKYLLENQVSRYNPRFPLKGTKRAKKTKIKFVESAGEKLKARIEEIYTGENKDIGKFNKRLRQHAKKKITILEVKPDTNVENIDKNKFAQYNKTEDLVTKHVRRMRNYKNQCFLERPSVNTEGTVVLPRDLGHTKDEVRPKAINKGKLICQKLRIPPKRISEVAFSPGIEEDHTTLTRYLYQKHASVDMKQNVSAKIEIQKNGNRNENLLPVVTSENDNKINAEVGRKKSQVIKDRFDFLKTMHKEFVALNQIDDLERKKFEAVEKEICSTPLNLHPDQNQKNNTMLLVKNLSEQEAYEKKKDTDNDISPDKPKDGNKS